MNSKQYVEQAVQTESRPASIAFGKVGLHATISLAILAGHYVDQVKRCVYYGTPIDVAKVGSILEQIAAVTQFLHAHNNARQLDNPNDLDALPTEAQVPAGVVRAKLENIDVRLLHASVGIFTESGEALEAILKQFETGELDKVNFGEEMGDVSWYQAIGFDASGVDLDENRAKNIAKLRKRYPEKFSAYDALHRDLAAERVILEGAPAANEELKAA
jgi:NTP pyrophosphatase (non-canonical NTP hydrolase)